MNSETPILCEPGMKYFINCSLKESHKIKEKHSSLLFNIIMTIILILIVSCIFYYRYKGRLTQQDIEKKNRKKQEYIVSKLQHMSAIREKNNISMISDLPVLVNNPELEMLKRYA
tara:strand:- start:1593 stop:1937 length:345 start_codon:yes stop_codon:yes gene_type:complete